MPKHVLAAAVLVVLLPLSACGDETTTIAEPTTPAGTYELVSVNGVLPFDTTMSDFGMTITYEVRGGSLILQEDGSYRSLTAMAATFDGDTEAIITEEVGLYTVSGGTLFLTPDGETRIDTGVLEGDAIRFEAEAAPSQIPLGTWIYRR